MSDLLDKLNDRQKEAVLATEGPVLVLAGAGSGKTTVLVNRIAYMISDKHIKPWNILAITFTNKAANEMKTRVENLLGEIAKNMWVGTFHSVCVRILRSCIDLLGYSRDFVIYDTSDTRTLMKECLRELNIDEKSFPVRNVLSIISNAKNDLMDAPTFDGFINEEFPRGGFERWDIEKLTDLFHEYLFDECLYRNEESYRLVKKILALHDAPGWHTDDFDRLIDIQLQNCPSSKKQRRRTKSYTVSQ